jgi:hypothetical protein
MVAGVCDHEGLRSYTAVDLDAGGHVQAADFIANVAPAP